MTSSDISAWIGRSQEIHDRISFNLVKRIAATLGEVAPAPGEALPLLWHWALFQEPGALSELGPDGHPRLGEFLPPAHNRNRMWAGSRLEFYKPLIVDAEATCKSTILNVEEKHGRSGSLLFVTIRHEYIQYGECVLQDEQDIVYREPAPAKTGNADPLPECQWREAVEPNATLLFRYSAVTFNGHRIHYDWPYVTETEGYQGLVVHGPLIATLNLRAFSRAHPRAQINRFTFRGVRPLISPQPFDVGGRLLNSGKAQVWAGNHEGAAQLGEVEFTLGDIK